MMNTSIYTQPNPVMPPAKSKLSLWKWLVYPVAILLVALLLIYTGGIDAISRLFGVGASGIYELSLTSTNDWLGTGSPRLVGNADMDGVNVFAKFGTIPEDIDVSEKGLGFVTTIFSSPGDTSKEAYTNHQYISPIMDMEYDLPYLNAFELVDYNPTATQTTQYYYRTASSVSNILDVYFIPLDTTLVKKTSTGIQIKSAPINQSIQRYVQIKVDLKGNTAQERSAVYAATVQYKESAGVTNLSTIDALNGTVKEYTLEIRYDANTAPSVADVEILSGNLKNAVVYSAVGVSLAGLSSYTLTSAMAPGPYALVVSGPSIENKIVPFAITGEELVRLPIGSFATTTGQITGDVNGDGVVNAGDLIYQINQGVPSQ
jgi:hypothetical protein